MTEEKIKKGLNSFLVFITCAINGTSIPREVIAQTDYFILWETAKRQKVTAIIAFAVCRQPEIKEVAGDDFFSRCEKKKMQQIRRNILFDKERERVISVLEEKEIWYMPLKGVVLQSYYPEYGMREMVDNDILYDQSRSEDLIEFLTGLGYQHSFENGSVHDCFYKKPFFNFEFHRALFGKDREWGDRYYSDFRRFLKKDTANNYGYHFSNNDLYVYIVCHAYKHYLGGGSGIRSIIDAYLLRDKDFVDDEYVQEQLKQIGISDFGEKIQLCGDKLFRSGISLLTEEEISFLSDLCGTHYFGGIDEASIGRKLLLNESDEPWSIKKIKYIIRRFVPNRIWMEEHYPILKKVSILFPLIYVFRVFRAFVTHPAKLIRELFVLAQYEERKK